MPRANLPRLFSFASCLAILALAFVVEPARTQSGGALPDWRRVPGFTYAIPGAMAQDPINGRVVQFGGLGSQAGALSTTRIWDGQTWTTVAGLLVTPPARTSAVMAYDYIRQRTVMFGGEDAAGRLLDTWEWDGVQWTQVVTATAPPAIIGASLAFDGNRSIMFGGLYNGLLSNQTWAFDGVDWSLLAPVVAPSPRMNVAMASGPSEILMFGGISQLAVMSDTWRWDGANWSEVATAVAPSPRQNAALAYAPAAARYLLFGGYAPFGMQDTWQFTAGLWTQFATNRVPPAVGSSAYHFASNRWIMVVAVNPPSPAGSSVTFEFGAELAYVYGYGQGCASAIGWLSMDLIAGQPRLGGSFELQLTPVLGIPLVALGWSRTMGPLGPLPSPLSLIGTLDPNCQLLQSSDIISLLPMLPDPSATIAIPNDPALVGSEFYAQGFDLPTLSMASLRATRGLRCGIDRL